MEVKIAQSWKQRLEGEFHKPYFEPKMGPRPMFLDPLDLKPDSLGDLAAGNRAYAPKSRFFTILIQNILDGK